MKKIDRFQKGMGVGGWLTNYKRFRTIPEDKRMDITKGDMEHFASYITKSDAINIKNMGFDHIRIGFDQMVMEKEPYVYREETFRYLWDFTEICESLGLRVVLNMHKAVGNYCDIEEDVTLFDNEELQNRFVALWVEFERRFSSKPEVMFELLNEVLNIEPDLWNNLAEKAVNAIHEINPERYIIVGSTSWNSVDKLEHLKIFESDKVIYTFHTYNPHSFTHQRGILTPWLYANMELAYPTSDVERYSEVQILTDGRSTERSEKFKEFKAIDKEFLKDGLMPAKRFIEEHPDKILWCGEFGTIRHCKPEYRENWMADVISILKEWDMPYCVWNYLSTPNDGNRFSLVDDDSRIILSERMLNIINGNV